MVENLGSTEKELIDNRIRKLEEIRALGANPFVSRSDRDIVVSELRKSQEKLIEDKTEVRVAGRIMAKRGHGKLIFADLVDESGKIQLVLRADLVKPEFFELVKLTDVGDFIEALGNIFITKAGELSIEVHELKILTKSIRPLPEQWYGIKDEELKFRKRYLDLILNPEVKELFYKKAKFWQSTRDFLVKKGFLEVETPALENTAGGADAEPFVTHHNAFDMDVYLRISMGELWQKRLMVGGYEKTFEIGRQFRNEGVSREHLQDYSQMEFYWAYANYEDSMELVREMYQYIAEQAFGTLKFKINSFDIDMSGKWEKIDYTKTIKEKLGIDVLEATEPELKEKLAELKIRFNQSDKRGRLIDTLWKQIRKSIAGPVFLVNHPVEVSPLAKRKEDDPRLVERYQVILAGSEMGNGYSELNDPIDQNERFKEQARMRAAGDAEAQMHDQDFVEALEYGMPPTTGFGFSERLFSFLLDKPIREAQIFPLMKPEMDGESKLGKSKETKIATIILNKSSNLNLWQQMNTVAHLSASFAGRSNALFKQDKIVTKDNKEINLNIKHAIMAKEAESNQDMHEVVDMAKASDLEVFEFVRGMIETSSDEILEEKTHSMNYSDVEFLGVLVYGKKGIVDEITKKYQLIK